MKEVSERRLEELRVRYEKLIKQFKNEKTHKGWKRFIKEKDGKAFIRCNQKLKSGKQGRIFGNTGY